MCTHTCWTRPQVTERERGSRPLLLSRSRVYSATPTGASLAATRQRAPRRRRAIQHQLHAQHVLGAYSIQRLLHTATEQPVAVTASYVLGVERAAPRGTREGGRQRAPLLRATRRPLGQASCQELLPLVACRSADKVQYRSRLRAGQELPRGPRGILMRSDACAPRRVLWRAVRHLRVGWHGA